MLGRYRIVLVIMLLLGSLNALQGQKHFNDGLYWLRLKFRSQFSEHWSASLEFEERRFISPDRAHQRVLPDLRVFYHFAPKWKTGLGYTNFSARSPGTASLAIQSTLSEQRFAFLLLRSFAVGPKAKIKGQWKSELRNFDRNPGDEKLEYLDYLVRLRFLGQYSLQINEDWRFALGDEIHLHPLGNTDHQLFDQNRIFGGFTKLYKHWSFSLNYIYWYQKNRKGNAFYSRHILRFTSLYNFSFN